MIQLNPIGFFYGDGIYKYDVPRQGCLFPFHPGVIKLNPHKNYEMALRDLEGFERIWIIFQFHKNQGWRPTTRPPIPPENQDRVGLFASRTPYRPNPIGLSCVKLLKIKKLNLYIDEADLLNETPILDIKPYIPMADAFPSAKAGWVENQKTQLIPIKMTEIFLNQKEWIKKHSFYDLENFAKIQLSNGKFSEVLFDSSRARVVYDKKKNKGILAYRTFRIYFKYYQEENEIELESIGSGYSKEELNNVSWDKYGDKKLHIEFLKLFDVNK